MRAIIFIIILSTFTHSVHAQIDSIDIALIKQKETTFKPQTPIRPYTHLHKSKWQTYNPINLTFSGLMFFYQNIISSQINASCLYSPSCSEYAKDCIKKYGLIKGMFLAADRVQKCNRITLLGLDLKKLNKHNRFNDSADDYSCKHN
ncbi:MAG: membrane protein insertion efficiency factor YidD [Bacteroidota bacterium]